MNPQDASAYPAMAIEPVQRPWPLILGHWATVLLLVLAAASILLRELVEDTDLRRLLLTLHQQTGMLVLLTMAARMLWRLVAPKLAYAQPLTRLHQWAATLTHLAIYLASCALPLLGWAASNARGMHLTLLGLGLPSLVLERDLDLADELIERHQLAAWLLLGLVCLHIAAALWHHFFLRDGLLLSMWPQRVKPRASQPNH